MTQEISMKTGKDYGLPAQYANWEDRDPEGNDFGGPFIAIGYCVADRGMLGPEDRERFEAVHMLLPPKLKTPDVGFSGVIRWTGKREGHEMRAVRIFDDSRGGRRWQVFELIDGEVAHIGEYSDDLVLDSVGPEGFTVELNSLA